jgi:hypothetical protein
MAMSRNSRDSESSTLLDDLLADAKKRTTFFPLPPQNFDPLTASSEELLYFGLPLKPDPKTQPEQLAFWLKMFSPPTIFLETDLFFSDVISSLNPPRPEPISATRYDRSSNWSGGYMTPYGGQMFVGMHGLFQVPTSKIPAAATGVAADYRSSTWIGLDGQRSYLNSTLPQIGTGQCIEIVNGQPTPKARPFVQWWARNMNYPIVYLTHFPVSPGDLIICSLYVNDLTTVTFHMKNLTTRGTIPTVTMTAPLAQVPPLAAPIQAKVSGATAEWILERPTRFFNGAIYDLPDYGTEVFRECFAVSALSPGSAGRVQKLPGARLINMFEVRENPPRTVDISVARPDPPGQVIRTIKTSFS